MDEINKMKSRPKKNMYVSWRLLSFTHSLTHSNDVVQSKNKKKKEEVKCSDKSHPNGIKLKE
jgi:hypothetical protein